MSSTAVMLSASVIGMPGARVISLNRGHEADMVIGGRPGRTAIDKRPVTGPVAAGPLGLEGDEYADKQNHGGVEQAVYAYAREDLDWWTEQLGRELRSGLFGENVTTAGIDISAALIGETWRMGTVVVQVTAPRIPCVTFKSWLDEPHWVKRFAAAGRPGAYLRVLTAGVVQAGDDLTVVGAPSEAVTVAESMRAFYGDRDIMRRLLTVEGRGSKWDEIAADMLSGV
ncbi:MAG TPA: MOSC domain-containing protein [Streptosporangiaceae bacterium]|jgi:MOSC domain-containing protein YiiM